MRYGGEVSLIVSMPSCTHCLRSSSVGGHDECMARNAWVTSSSNRKSRRELCRPHADQSLFRGLAFDSSSLPISPAGPLMEGILATGKLVNVPDLHKDDRFDPEVDKYTGVCVCLRMRRPQPILLEALQLFSRFSILVPCLFFRPQGILHRHEEKRGTHSSAKIHTHTNTHKTQGGDRKHCSWLRSRTSALARSSGSWRCSTRREGANSPRMTST